jgi:CheY-like chemotaxis protein
VLVVEDNLVNQTVAQRILAKAGHRTVVVGDGMQALQALDGGTFDLVIMDGNMPVMDGFEATRQIRRREQETGGHLPVIGLTALALKGDEERCLAAGMDHYISKPFKPREMEAAIAALFAPAP